MDDERIPVFMTAAEALAEQRGVPVQQVLDEDRRAAENPKYICSLDACNEERTCQYVSTCLIRQRFRQT